MKEQLWLTEPAYKKWTDPATGYSCCVVRHGEFLHLCGYVRVPKGHAYYRASSNGKVERRVRVHGGVTFSGRVGRPTGGQLRGHWFGFDCAHHMDLVPGLPEDLRQGKYRTFDYVQREVTKLAAQLKEVMK